MGDLFYKDKFPGNPDDSADQCGRDAVSRGWHVSGSREGWGDTSGVVQKDGDFYTWSHAKLADGDFTAIAPLSREYLSKMVPNLGVVQFLLLRPTTAGRSHLKIGDTNVEVQRGFGGANGAVAAEGQ